MSRESEEPSSPNAGEETATFVGSFESSEGSSSSEDPFLREVARIDDAGPPRRSYGPGQRLGDRYEIVDMLGVGGQGAVWDALDTLTNERVAVKILRTVSPTCAARVRREIAVLRLLRLPGVVRLVDEGLDGDRPFLVTERISGRPFPGIPVPAGWSELEPVFLGLLDTLARIHAAGIVHRDLKPDNVLVGPDKRPVVLDFGLSYLSAGARDRLTATGQIVGTLSYLAPEQLREMPATARTDLFSVGIMAHLALAGRVPHERRDMCEFLIARVGQPSPSLRDVAKDVPAEVAIVLDQLLALDPADRPRSAAEVAARLRNRMLPSVRTLDIPPPLRRLLGAEANAPDICTEDSLRDVFSGPDRLLHLQEDAARVLFLRTGGDRERAMRELRAWVRAGLARWDGDRVAMGRDAIEELEAGLVVATNEDEGLGRPSFSRPQWDLVAWIALAHPHADVDVVARAMGEPREDVATEIAALERAGVVRGLPGGRYDPVAFVDVGDHWTPELRQRAHRRLAAAMPRGAAGRLLHLLKGVDEHDPYGSREVAREVATVSRRLAEEGHTARATLLVCEGVRALRQNPHLPEDLRVSLFAVWVEIALAENTPIALDRVLYELCRPGHESPGLAHLASLVRAALAASAWTASSWTARALVKANAVPQFVDPALERRRQGVRVLAARRAPLAVEEAMLAEVVAWAEASGDIVSKARAASWLGRLRYRQGRFDEAAAQQAAAAEGEDWLVTKLWARLLGASALLEAFRFEEAAAMAREALALSRHCRHALCEGRAEWILRSVDYRTGALDAGPVDRELVEAAPLVGVADLEPLVCLNEAAVAMRMGDRALARSLAERAYLAWKRQQERVGFVLSASFYLALGGTLAEAEMRPLVADAISCTIPGVGIQSLALLAAAGEEVPRQGEAVDALVALVEPRFRECRMDVLSVKESLEWLSRP
jgi:hypothetical protein